MRTGLRRVSSFLNSIAGQLMILLLVAACLLMAGTFVLLRVVFEARTPPPVIVFIERQIATAEMLNRLAPENQMATLASLDKDHKGVIYRWEETDFILPDGLEWRYRNRRPLPANSKNQRPFPPMGQSTIPFARQIADIDEQRLAVTLYFKLPNERVFSTSAILEIRPPISWAVSSVLTFVAISLVLLMLWAFFFLIKPIKKLSDVADHVAREGTTPYRAPVAGPTELRGAAKAMNRMQDRIHQLLEDRTRMLAAVGHDLRTPVTRLRLRADLIQPDDMREALLRDIHQMDGELARLLTFFKGGQSQDSASMLQLASLVESLVDQWSDAGYSVSLGHCTPSRVYACADDLARMIDNLIDNAIKYAGQCEVTMHEEQDGVCLRVIDHGPGIDDRDKDRLMEPFARGDEARTLDEKSGFGLGLAIAQQVATAHNAKLSLVDTEGGGLTVEVRLPKAS